MPFFLTSTLHPAGLLVKDTGYSDLETMDAQLVIRNANAVIMDIFIFILYRGNVILELLPLRYYSLVK